MLDRWIQTIALLASEPSLGQIGTIATLGHTDDLPDGQVAIHRAPIVADSVCYAPNANFLFAQTPNAGLCTGDSGSGFSRVFVNRASVLGIAAYTPYQSGCDTPGLEAGPCPSSAAGPAGLLRLSCPPISCHA